MGKHLGKHSIRGDGCCRLYRSKAENASCCGRGGHLSSRSPPAFPTATPCLALRVVNSNLDKRSQGIWFHQFRRQYRLPFYSIHLTPPYDLCNSFATHNRITVVMLSFLSSNLSNTRQSIAQVLNFALVLSTAFMLWKGLSVVTASSSPIVVGT